MPKISIKSAKNKQSLTSFPLDVEHVTTSDFGSIFPTMCLEVVPGDKFHINYSQFTRLSPLAVPTFGRMSVVSRAFFIPNSSLFPQWRKWIVNDHEGSDPINYPSMTNRSIYSEIINGSNGLSTSISSFNFGYLKQITDFDDSGFAYFTLVDVFGSVLKLPILTGTISGPNNVSLSYYGSGYFVLRVRSTFEGAPFIITPHGTKPASSPQYESLLSLLDSMPRSALYNYLLPSGSSSGYALVATESTLQVIFLTRSSSGSYSYVHQSSSYGFAYLPASSNLFSTFSSSGSLLELGIFDVIYSPVLADFGSPYWDGSSQPPSGSLYSFTSKGRLFMKVMAGLGYKINLTWYDDTDMSLLPLLSYCRIMYDYLYPSNFVRSINVNGLFDDFKKWTSDHDVFSAILRLFFAPLTPDYFTLAWQEPNAVHPDVSNEYPSMTVPTTGQQVGSNVQDSYLDLKDNSQGQSVLTSFGLRMLDAISDFVIRNNIAGTRYFEQMRARFGLKGANIDPDKSRFLQTWSDEVQISDVTATNGTSSQLLGEQAGKGISSGNGHSLSFDNTNGDYGWLIVVTQLVPKTSICQGRMRHTLKTSYLDFFTPEFEKMGLQPIRNDELYAQFTSSSQYQAGLNYGGEPSNVFGYAPRYSEYKKPTAILSGDFQFNSRNVGMEAYHLMRILPMPSSSFPLALNLDFMSVQQKDYDRVFSQITDDEGNEFDHFFQWFYFDVKASRPMLSIGESMPIENGSGDETLDYEGVHMTT